MFIVTDKAAEKITALLEGDGKDVEKYGLRVGVAGGGCSGFQYVMDFDEPRAGDKVYENGRARVLIDPKSEPFIDGSVLDYLEGLQGAGFTVRNPNATGSCGCGSSFSV